MNERRSTRKNVSASSLLIYSVTAMEGHHSDHSSREPSVACITDKCSSCHTFRSTVTGQRVGHYPHNLESSALSLLFTDKETKGQQICICVTQGKLRICCEATHSGSIYPQIWLRLQPLFLGSAKRNSPEQRWHRAVMKGTASQQPPFLPLTTGAAAKNLGGNRTQGSCSPWRAPELSEQCVCRGKDGITSTPGRLTPEGLISQSLCSTPRVTGHLGQQDSKGEGCQRQNSSN
nr:uncharacterized protein LOC105710198 [Aotus nancymaae]